jgi:hypothetical protein
MPSPADIIVHTPVWVWAILAVILVRGAQATRPLPRRPLTLPLLPGGFMLWSLYNFLSGAQWAGLAVWGAGLALGLGLAWRWQRDVVPEPLAGGDLVLVPGSAVFLVTLLVIFACNYAYGVVRAVAPQQAGHPLFAFGLPAIGGLCNGVLNGRAWRLLVNARRR